MRDVDAAPNRVNVEYTSLTAGYRFLTAVNSSRCARSRHDTQTEKLLRIERIEMGDTFRSEKGGAGDEIRLSASLQCAS